ERVTEAVAHKPRNGHSLKRAKGVFRNHLIAFAHFLNLCIETPSCPCTLITKREPHECRFTKNRFAIWGAHCSALGRGYPGTCCIPLLSRAQDVILYHPFNVMRWAADDLRIGPVEGAPASCYIIRDE